jgi:hypothetical protein
MPVPKRIQAITVYGASLAHMWEDCPRCFWRRYVLGEKRPSDFSNFYDVADGAMKAWFDAQPTSYVDVGVGPRVRLLSHSGWLRSRPIAFAHLNLTIRLCGRYDTLNEDEDLRTHLIDFKTSSKPDEELYRYRRQLEAYRYCLENPDPADTTLAPPLHVDEVGLLVYTPQKFAVKSTQSGLYGPTRWIGFKRDDSAFMKLLGDVAILLSHDEPPSPSSCTWCKYRSIGEAASLIGTLHVSNLARRAPSPRLAVRYGRAGNGLSAASASMRQP